MDVHHPCDGAQPDYEDEFLMEADVTSAAGGPVTSLTIHWDELVRTLLDVFNRHRIGLGWMLYRMRGRLRWPPELQTWLVRQAFPVLSPQQSALLMYDWGTWLLRRRRLFKWRVVGWAVMTFLSSHRRAAERVYAPGGTGALDAAMEFGGLV